MSMRQGNNSLNTGATQALRQEGKRGCSAKEDTRDCTFSR
jgi:hypothetical protein